jgi:hypothetical protein
MDTISQRSTLKDRPRFSRRGLAGSRPLTVVLAVDIGTTLTADNLPTRFNDLEGLPAKPAELVLWWAAHPLAASIGGRAQHLDADGLLGRCSPQCPLGHHLQPAFKTDGWKGADGNDAAATWACSWSAAHLCAGPSVTCRSARQRPFSRPAANLLNALWALGDPGRDAHFPAMITLVGS